MTDAWAGDVAAGADKIAATGALLILSRGHLPELAIMTPSEITFRATRVIESLAANDYSPANFADGACN